LTIAGFDNSAFVFQIKFKDAIHPRKGHDDPAARGIAPPTQTRSGASADQRNLVFASDAENLHQIVGGAWKGDDSGRALSTPPSYS